MIKYDTYHDTSDQLPHGARALSDGGWYLLTGQRWLRRRRWVLQDDAQVAPALGTPCLGPCGPRDMIS